MQKMLSTILENKMPVNIYSFPELETVGISVGIKYGSVDENPEINGSAHFLEHMMFKGTSKLTWKEINDQTKAIGAYANATTDREATNYMFQVHKLYIEKTMDILSSMISNSILPQKEFELERGPIINENLIREDNPEYLFYDYMPKLLFKGHPAQMPVGGNNNVTIKKITREHLFNIYKKYYTPQNMVLTISGGISIDKAKKLAEKYFGSYNMKFNSPKRNKFNGNNKYRAMTVEKRGIKQAKLAIGFSCPSFDRKKLEDYVAMILSNELLQYRIYEEVREKRGLSYDPQSVYTAGETIGMISAEAGTEPKNIDLVKKIILDEFKKMSDGEFTAIELDRMRTAIKIRYETLRERTLESAVAISTSAVIKGIPNLFNIIPKLIGKITIDDVRRVSNKNIDCDKYSMVLLKPKA